MNKTESMNLLFAIDRSCIKLLKSCISSIERNGGYDAYIIYVLHSDLKREDQKSIMESSKRCTWHFVDVPEHLFEGFPVFKRYPKQIYYRLAAAKLLPDPLDKILYLDVDTIVINSLKSLYEMDLKDHVFAGCTNTGRFLTTFNQFRMGLQIDKNIPYLNTGVLMMNLKQMRKYVSFDEIQKYAEKHAIQLWLPDQDILMALYGQYCLVLDAMIYNLSDRTLMWHNTHFKTKDRNLNWVEQNTVVVHYFGRNKPWKKRYHGILDVYYHRFADKSCSI